MQERAAFHFRDAARHKLRSHAARGNEEFPLFDSIIYFKKRIDIGCVEERNASHRTRFANDAFRSSTHPIYFWVWSWRIHSSFG